MSEVVARVRRTIERHRLMTPDTRAIVALSGGSDSVALADVLCQLDQAGDLHVVAFAHFNHQLRPRAKDDERFCEQLAATLGRRLVCGSEDVGSLARLERRSVEDAAHRARHAFLERARESAAADVIALGHTRDDQAETYLLRLLRGAGTRGLASMHASNGHIVRPLLECRRAELRDYLRQRHLEYVDDESNADVSIPRNRVRVELLPLLQSRFNAGIVDVLADQAEIAREEWSWMDAEARRVIDVVRHVGGNEWRIDVDALVREPVALRRFALHRVMTEAAAGRPIAFHHVNAALDLMRRPSGTLAMPGHRVQRLGTELVLSSRPPENLENPENPENLENPGFMDLPVPGEIVLSGRRSLSAEPVNSADKEGDVLVGRGPVAVVRRDLCSGGLRVRWRRPGDRFRPLGLEGVKKLQDFFVDRKVPAGERDLVPLVVDADDRIVWVAGHAPDDRFRVTDPAQAVIILRLKVLGGSA